ncbi:GerW family sporulation protein [Staphylospora marina]|uniref:GerW family sporulation protein n=1 Tax=Staphylospora marina TaxID=2490858 RepID=UPI000F5BD74D|nr:GerW family sporulation protein [Staphylospora marina]
MAEHPIQGLMTTAMESIREMVDVNTIIGEPVETGGHVIIPISKVGFGFAAGGSEFTGIRDESGSDRGGDDRRYGGREDQDNGEGHGKFPFGGGSGGGVSITPVGFIVMGDCGVKLISMDTQTHLFDRLIDMAPNVLEQLKGLSRKRRERDDFY